MTRAATVRLVAEEEATGKVAEIYADIKATKGIFRRYRISGGYWPATRTIWR